ncbi:TPA: hypothetical protein HA235_01075 [Candidatus Woesearchaeota archaeon]|nr:hypothetical protein [Candidatus Woesearchaeota archaeon]HIH31276.1 hypothetical protein [Candidatus Woesearchaeota archaeon]HIH54496.1 hypothetical protein [Candidatus Woesearchaeota archaeon]HIJ01999.1 hypothetical protein [Candidatus Woesearchaeota archaeon]HIJ14500.1 hypothetical protein [Candidatus Woesearchaeota archaeon]
MDLRNIFDKTEVLLVLAIILGLIIGLKARISIDIPLGIVMFFSIRPFFRHKFDFKKKYKFIILSVLLNYVLLSGVYVLLSSIFFGQINFYLIGFLIVACVPPAIAIVPFCYLTKCDPETADASLFSAFVLGIFLMPLSLFLLFGENIDMLLLLRVMLIIIIIPGIFAYLLRDRKSKVFNYTKSITNICLALVLFIAVSVNREVFFTLNRNVLLSYFISFLAIFGTGLIVYFIAKLNFEKSEAINFSLYASQKNVGTAIAIALLIFNPVVAVPAVIALVVQFLYFLVFERIVLKN